MYGDESMLMWHLAEVALHCDCGWYRGYGRSSNAHSAQLVRNLWLGEAISSGSDTDEGRVDDARLTRSRSLRVSHVFQALRPGDERRLRAENRARAYATARETALAASQALAIANAAAREQAAAAMATAAASSAASSSRTQLGMPPGSTGTSGSLGSSQSTSQMAGSQFSPLTPRGRELLELQQVERIRTRLERELKQATDREKEIKNRTVRLDTLEADKADQMKVLKASILSLHAHVDSRLDFMQDQILDLLQRPRLHPAAQSSLPLTTMSGPFPVQAGTQPSGKWLDGIVATVGYGRRMADWGKTHTLEEFLDMVEARWHNPQQAQIAIDAMLRLDQRKYKSVRELTSTVENLIVVLGIHYDDQVLLTMFLRCLPENLRTLLASEARLEYHSFETLSRKALDLEGTLGSAQPTPVDGRKKKSPQEWKKKGSRLMMLESDGTQTEIDELSDLMDSTKYDGEETVEGSTLATVVKTKASGRGKGHQKSQGKAASNQTKVVDWVKAVLIRMCGGTAECVTPRMGLPSRGVLMRSARVLSDRAVGGGSTRRLCESLAGRKGGRLQARHFRLQVSAKGDDSVPSEMTLGDALSLLGVAEGASFDEILRAKKSIMATCEGDQEQQMKVEAAYDMLLMQSLSKRRSGQVDGSVKYADVRRQGGAALKIGGGTEWLRDVLTKTSVSVQSPPVRDVAIQAAVFGTLAAWTFANGLSHSDTLTSASQGSSADLYGFQLAIGFGSSIYFLRNQNLGLARSTLLTVAGLVVGSIMGGLLESWLQVDIIPVFGISSPSVIISEFAFLSLWLTCTYLR
ncbi:hypothetical protein CBR_g40579 [Chara braunii]|uniref:Uncharacterized protein n=1 Tax=Chara braunii TaxID=69332 RepID=A0A388K249_CHABU|nr:hypothetical protein CBR_g40579 [Chara braunii]|eukprot:GBG64132.1 hypothetical protein CBR_g40579 [Chara braunii]